MSYVSLPSLWFSLSLCVLYVCLVRTYFLFFFFQAEDGIRDWSVTGVQTCALPILRKTPTLRAVADVQFGPDPAEWDLWIGYEAVFNRSFGHLPAWVLCSYDANGIPDPVIEGVWQTHSDVLADEKWSASDRFEDPDRVLREVTPTPAPLAGLRSVRFGRDL